MVTGAMSAGQRFAFFAGYNCALRNQAMNLARLSYGDLRKMYVLCARASNRTMVADKRNAKKWDT
jgi:hypothetical protein